MKTTIWTDERTARLRELWCNTKKAADEIGAELGTARGSVISKAHRIGLPYRREKIRPQPSEPRPLAANYFRG